MLNDNNNNNNENKNILKNISYLPNEILFTLGTYMHNNEILKLSNINERLKEHFELPFYNEKRLLICSFLGDTIEKNNNLILGYPVRLRYYNKSSIIVSIDSLSDLVSYEGYKQKKCIFWLPIMMNSNSLSNINFKKILKEKIIEIAVSTKSIRTNLSKNHNNNYNPWDNVNIISEEKGKYTFEDRLEYLKSKMVNPEFYFEEFVVNVLSHFMFSTVYNMYLKDITFFDSMLNKYSQIHKLFYCLSKEYPVIENIVNMRIKNFILKIKNRHISHLPYLCMIFVYLSISKTYHIEDVIELIIEENYKRNFKLIIEKLDCVPHNSNFLFFKDKLSYIWNIVSCTNKMILLHCCLLNNISRIKNKSLNDIMKSYDYYYGQVPRDIKDSFKIKYYKIFKINSFKEYYQELGLHYHSDVFLSRQLFRAFEISNKIRYIILTDGIYNNEFYNNNDKYSYLNTIIL